MRGILVATDRFERSGRAVRHVFRPAREHGAAWHVLNGVDDALSRDLAETLRPRPGPLFWRFVDAQGTARHNCRRGARPKSRYRTVRPAPAAPGPDMGCETAVTRRVQLPRAPTLLVRDPATHEHEWILVHVRFSDACAAARRTARKRAPEAETFASHAVDLPFAGLTHEHRGGAMDHELTAEAEATRNTWCAAQGLSKELCAVTPVTGSLGPVTDRHIKDFKPDLIALGTHTRSRFSIHPLGRFAAALVRDPPTDLLLAHP